MKLFWYVCASFSLFFLKKKRVRWTLRRDSCLVLASLYLQVSTCTRVQLVFLHVWLCLCLHMFVCTCKSVQAASGCLRFTFPFRLSVSRLAPNEPITGSNIWCVLYGSPGSAISVDESWERCGNWAGQLSEKIQICVCIDAQRRFTMTQSLLMEWTKKRDLERSAGLWNFFHFMSL